MGGGEALSKIRKRYLELLDKGVEPEKAMRIALGKEEEAEFKNTPRVVKKKGKNSGKKSSN